MYVCTCTCICMHLQSIQRSILHLPSLLFKLKCRGKDLVNGTRNHALHISFTLHQYSLLWPLHCEGLPRSSLRRRRKVHTYVSGKHKRLTDEYVLLGHKQTHRRCIHPRHSARAVISLRKLTLECCLVQTLGQT